MRLVKGTVTFLSLLTSILISQLHLRGEIKRVRRPQMIELLALLNIAGCLRLCKTAASRWSSLS